MGKSFAPYTEALLPIVTEHMTYPHNKSVRKYALRTFTNILIAIGEPNNIALLNQAFPTYLQEITKALDKMDQKNTKLWVQQLANILRALNKHNQHERQFLTQA